MFKKYSIFYSFRWFIMVAASLLGIMLYADASGYKIFNTTSEEKFTAGTHANYIYHK